ncbi:hypothetical protein [Williamsia sp.]|uniref:hypothetical protein n=1 Tax=Williamsia sp. TaxID=1872085 RepID=UPI001A20DFF2|nr:hypothetical protein [Williamsia sp.]MBJ7287986.1 hypothetical protein [Williamsia sp.]
MSNVDASVSWLVELEAIAEGQASRLSAIYDLRHERTHDLVEFVVDVGRNPDIDLLTDACKILKAIGGF